jgi:hypothetical protein
LHLELQASRDPDLVPNLLLYNALLDRRHRSLVRTVVVLLRKSADAPDLGGPWRRAFPSEPTYLDFRFRVIRLWGISPETLLNGGLAIVALAPLSDVTESQLPAVVRRMDERFQAETTPENAGLLWTAAGILMGLRFESVWIRHLIQGVRGMKESVMYQAIVEEGIVKARHDDILRQGRKRFGATSLAVELALGGIADPDRLARMLDRLHEVSSWDELLATP